MAEDTNNRENIDSNSTLKDSGTGVKFQEELQQSAQYSYSNTPRAVQWVIRYSGGYIKDEKQANYVLIGFVVAAVIISLFLVFGDGNEQNTFTPSADAPPAEVVPPAEF
ncbi:hypothetical protein IIB50_02020 [Patescibacteria group bacterium]|nr:hypothetical protein [Patescibacteria group bacterium]